MEWLLHNPLAQMYGPRFLLLYAGVITTTLALCHLYLRRRDQTTRLPLRAVPANPDPYEIAFLRGGENEVVRAVLFSLVQRSYLHVNQTASSATFSRVSGEAMRSSLQPLEQAVLPWFSVPRTTTELFGSAGLAKTVEPYCAVYEQRLKRDHLITPPDVRQTAVQVWLTGAGVIVLFGSYKLFVALSHGHRNVLLLILFGFVALAMLAAICRTPRLSAKGKLYLQRLQLAYGTLRTKPTHPLNSRG